MINWPLIIGCSCTVTATIIMLPEMNMWIRFIACMLLNLGIVAIGEGAKKYD